MAAPLILARSTIEISIRRRIKAAICEINARLIVKSVDLKVFSMIYYGRY
jgi:hypothetical protein